MPDIFLRSGSGEELNAEHVAALMDLYERTLDDLGYVPVKYAASGERVGANILSGARFDCLNHAYWLCGCIRRLIKEHRWEKCQRCLGMVQGLLFMGGVYSLDDLMLHERSLPS